MPLTHLPQNSHTIGSGIVKKYMGTALTGAGTSCRGHDGISGGLGWALTGAGTSCRGHGLDGINGGLGWAW